MASFDLAFNPPVFIYSMFHQSDLQDSENTVKSAHDPDNYLTSFTVTDKVSPSG